MTRLLTPHIATMTELRDPRKVLERAKGHPMAVLRSSEGGACFIPAALAHTEWVDPAHSGYGSLTDLFDALSA